MISFFHRALLLAVSAGFSFSLFILLASLKNGRSPRSLDPGVVATLSELFGFVVVGFMICAIFGTPFLYLIDKYCPRWRFRYVLGGAIAGWFVWFILASPLFTPSVWFVLEHWYLHYDNWSLVYTSAGLYAGITYSVALRCTEKWIEHRSKGV